ncbi:MAG: ABC transporter permease [Actinomycetota bacterium]|nr:ABC transporter permease [Actinomycetota bacterium]
MDWRQELRWVMHDSVVLIGVNLRHFIRKPRLVVFSTIEPVMFVLLFAYVFGGALSLALPPGTSYVDFLLPGIFVQSAAFRAIQTSVGLAEDLEGGVVDRFRSMPMARSAMLVGRTVADLARSLFVILVMVVVGYLVGFRFRSGALEALGAIAVVALFGFALSWIFAWLALTVQSVETAQSASFVAIYPLVFASSVFVPVETMPSWIGAVVRFSPVTLTANAARDLSTMRGPITDDLLGALAWMAAIILVFVPLAIRRFRQVS